MPASLRLPRLVWILFWSLMGACLVLDLVAHPEQLAQSRYLLWLACMAGYALASSLICRSCLSGENRGRVLAVSALQTCGVLFMVTLSHKGFEAGLLSMLAFQLGFVLPMGRGLVWILAQTSLYTYLMAPAHHGLSLLLNFTGMLAYQFMALAIAHFSASEFRARRELTRANAELRLSQEILATTSRIAERQRISRELHDLAGPSPDGHEPEAGGGEPSGRG
ncbi:MAG: hypothetical protein ACE5HD_12560 [Acidobacteriota bacterium]